MLDLGKAKLLGRQNRKGGTGIVHIGVSRFWFEETGDSH